MKRKVRLHLIAFICLGILTTNTLFAEEGIEILISKPIRGENSVILQWLTGTETKSQVDYGTDEGLGLSVSDNTFLIEHNIELTDLIPNAKYYYRIKSTDVNERVSVSEILTFWTDVTTPTMRVISPIDRTTVSGITMISVETIDNTGISEIGFYLDGKQKGTDSTPPFEIYWDTSECEDGEHVLFVYTTDVSGNFDMEIITVTVRNRSPDTTPPVVKISSPADGQVISGDADIKITIDATDDQKMQPGSVYCFINNKYGQEVAKLYFGMNPPYESEWGTSFKWMKKGLYEYTLEIKY